VSKIPPGFWSPVAEWTQVRPDVAAAGSATVGTTGEPPVTTSRTRASSNRIVKQLVRGAMMNVAQGAASFSNDFWPPFDGGASTWRRPARLPQERQASRLPLRSGRVFGELGSTYFSEEDRFLRRGQVFLGGSPWRAWWETGSAASGGRIEHGWIAVWAQHARIASAGEFTRSAANRTSERERVF
jgi:hypothetical protein